MLLKVMSFAVQILRDGEVGHDPAYDDHFEWLGVAVSDYMLVDGDYRKLAYRVLEVTQVAMGRISAQDAVLASTA
jgi:hypothetical protein